MMNLKKKIAYVVILAIVFCGIGNINYNHCQAEELITVNEAKEVVDDLNCIIKDNQDELIQEYIEGTDYSEEEVDDMLEEIQDGDIDEVLDDIEEDVDENIIDELSVSDLADLEKQPFINPETNEAFESVEDVKKYIENIGCEIDEDEYALYEAIEDIKDGKDMELQDLLVEADQILSDTDDNESWLFGETVEASSVYTETKKQWESLTTQEKALIVLEPKKAMVTKALTEKAYNMTKEEFGYNGLGDKSDGFRHATWNALLTRDITRAWADTYTTAHESGKSKKQLEKKAPDGYKEKTHRAMDLHNNAEGRDVIHWYDTALNVSDKNLKDRVKKKLTNKKSDIYWLHK